MIKENQEDHPDLKIYSSFLSLFCGLHAAEGLLSPPYCWTGCPLEAEEKLYPLVIDNWCPEKLITGTPRSW